MENKHQVFLDFLNRGEIPYRFFTREEMEEKKETLKAIAEEGVLIVTPNENDDGVVLIGGEQSQAFKLKQPARPKDMHERVNQSLLTLKNALQQFKEAHGAEKAPDDLMRSSMSAPPLRRRNQNLTLRE